MASVNKAIIMGNVGADPELRYTSDGRAMCKFSVATNRRFKDKSGAQQERVCWHRVVAWGKQGELCGEYLKRGRRVYVEGRIERSSYKDSAGVERTSTEIVSQSVIFLSPKAGSLGAAPAGGYALSPGPSSETSPITSDEIPF